MKNIINFLVIAIGLFGLSAIAETAGWFVENPPQPDFAQVEKQLPMTPEFRNYISFDYLKTLNQEQLDQLYARLKSGPIPQGDFEGIVISRNPAILDMEKMADDKLKGQPGIGAKLARWLIGLKCGKKDRLDCLGEFLWSGKRFKAPQPQTEVVELRNAINPMISWKWLGKRVGLESISEALKSHNIKKENFYGKQRMMIFPANVYCGLSLIDVRRESIIIDYAYGDDFKDYVPEVDGLVGRNGLWIRDEIRMIRPGLYLGKAYVDKIFLLNFALHNPSLDKKYVASEDRKNCWSGDSWQ